VKWGGTDWLPLAQDREKWQALVNAVWNPYIKCREFLAQLKAFWLLRKDSTL